MTVKCKKCGTEWASKEEIVDATIAEHKKILGHVPEIEK